MKSKTFLVIMFLLCLVSFTTVVQGANDYTWEVPEDNLFIYEIKSFDEDLAEDIFVNPDIEDVLGEDAEIGAMKANMITDIDDIDDFNNDATEDDPGWEFEGWFWSAEWTDNEEDFDDPDTSDITEFSGWRLAQDPEEYGTLALFAELIFFLIVINVGVPSPADEWLNDIDFATLEVEGSSLVLEYDSTVDASIDEDYDQYWEFKSNGQYNGYRAETTDGDIIYEVNLQGFLSSIPGYEFPLLLGFMAISLIGVLYLSFKKE